MPAGSADAARLWTLNFRLLTGVIDEAARGIEALGFEVREFFVLDGVEELSYPAQLAQRLSIPRPSITLYLKNLEAKGFVRREIDPDDLRRHRLTITASGRKAVARARTILSDRYGERLARLSERERAELRRLLQTLSG